MSSRLPGLLPGVAIGALLCVALYVVTLVAWDDAPEVRGCGTLSDAVTIQGKVGGFVPVDGSSSWFTGQTRDLYIVDAAGRLVKIDLDGSPATETDTRLAIGEIRVQGHWLDTCAVAAEKIATNTDPCVLPLGRGCVVPEDKGKVVVTETDRYQELVSEYGRDRVSIRALEINLVQDVEFVEQLNAGFTGTTGCIIVLEALGEGWVFQEDADLNIVSVQSLAAFQTRLATADPAVVERFYSSLH